MLLCTCSSGLLGENITCEENMEIMKKEIAATQYIYPENDETFGTCDDLSKNEGIPHNSILFFVLCYIS